MEQRHEPQLREILISQYHAALAMLRQAIAACPEDLWTSTEYPNRFWHVAYHTLFYAHLYLHKNEAAFTPWEHSRPEYQYMGPLPWPPHDLPQIGAPYSKSEVLEYWDVCDEMVDASVNQLDLGAPDCGFWWYKMSKCEHQLVNIRHIQHHAAQLADRLRNTADIAGCWIGSRATAFASLKPDQY